MCAQAFLIFCDSLDCSLPGSSLHGIFQARNTGVHCYFLLQWSSQPRDQTHISCVSYIGSIFLPTEPLGKSQRNLEAHKISFIWETETTIYHTAIVKITPQHTSKTIFYNIWHVVNAKWMLSSVQLLSRGRLFATPWTAARQASLSVINSQSLLKLMSMKCLACVGMCLEVCLEAPQSNLISSILFTPLPCPEQHLNRACIRQLRLP